jgi:hypothetical protein
VRISAFEVFARMQATDDQALKLAPLSNVLGVRMVRAGTRVTIGVAGNVIHQILNDEFLGGLLLVDRKRFEEVKSQMERER